MKTRKKYLLADVELTYGTPPTFTNANAIITSNLSREIYGGPMVSRDNDRSGLGARQMVNTAPMMMETFEAEMMGSGTLGTPPNIGKILRACGFSETIDAGVEVKYQPISAGYESISTLYHRDGEAQTGKGMRGTGGLSVVAGQIPKFNFSLTGLYTKPVTATAVVPAPTPNIAPVPANYTNTTAFKINAVDLAMQSLNIDFGNNVVHMNMVNFNEVLITDRNMTGNVVILAPTIATTDLMTLIQSDAGASTYTMSMTHGVSPNLIALTAQKVQFHTISEVDIDGEQGYSIDFVITPNITDNDIAITFK